MFEFGEVTDEFVCSGCSATLSWRQLTTKSITTESCPHCQEMIRQGETFRYKDAEACQIRDISGIDGWLENECKHLHQTLLPDRSREADGQYRWQVTGSLMEGCPPNWVLEVVYATGIPEVVGVQVTSVETSVFADEVMGRVREVMHDHGLQPHGSRSTGFGVAGTSVQTRWGAQQLLRIAPTTEGLLRPVVQRLLVAMRDAETTRRHS